jgi:hypothetical protein
VHRGCLCVRLCLAHHVHDAGRHVHHLQRSSMVLSAHLPHARWCCQHICHMLVGAVSTSATCSLVGCWQALAAGRWQRLACTPCLQVSHASFSTCAVCSGHIPTVHPVMVAMPLAKPGWPLPRRPACKHTGSRVLAGAGMQPRLQSVHASCDTCAVLSDHIASTSMVDVHHAGGGAEPAHMSEWQGRWLRRRPPCA